MPLAPKTFDLLLLLSESRGRVLTKGELMGALWKEAFVEDANLGYQVSMLRKALGEEGAGWIETAPKIGYRFTAPVETAAPIAAVAEPDPPAVAAAPGRRWLTPLLGGAIAVTLAVGWGLQSFNRIRRARQESLPKIASLAEEGRFCAAFALANQTESLLGKGDIKLAALQREIARTAGLDTEPSGAEVFYSDLRSSEKEWRALGKTPLTAVSIPRGYFRLRFEKPGFETTYGLFGAVTDYRKYSLFPKTDIPPGMVPVPPASPVLPRRFSDDGTNSPASRFLIDRYEVTNRQFKEFVEAGGYRDRKFWKQPFANGAKPISWAEAMTAFHDSTGRPGPSTWEAGNPPPGREEFPVSGVSWYEAAAYAEYAGKQLPTIRHWYAAAQLDSAPWFLPTSNFSGTGVARVESIKARARLEPMIWPAM